MITVNLDPQNFYITLTKLDKFFAMCGTLTVPLCDIQQVYQRDKFEKPKGMKIKGTRFGRKALGTFIHKGGEAFWAFNAAASTLVIELRADSTLPYNHLFLGLDDAQFWRNKLTQMIADDC